MITPEQLREWRDDLNRLADDPGRTMAVWQRKAIRDIVDEMTAALCDDADDEAEEAVAAELERAMAPVRMIGSAMDAIQKAIAAPPKCRCNTIPDGYDPACEVQAPCGRRVDARGAAMTRENAIPKINNRCTLADLRAWLRDSSKLIKGGYPEAAYLLRKHHVGGDMTEAECGMLVWLAGGDDRDSVAWICVMLELLTVPPLLQQAIELDIREHTVCLNPPPGMKIEFVGPRAESAPDPVRLCFHCGDDPTPGYLCRRCRDNETRFNERGHE